MAISPLVQRALFSDDGTLTDWTLNLGKFEGGSHVFASVATEDYLLIGSDMPFNHKWFELSVFNSVTAAPTVEIWNGSAWVSAVDVIDETSVSGASLGQSGIIRWSPDIDQSTWNCQQESEDVTGLTGTKIYNKYWARFSWSATLTGTTALFYIGHRFCDDDHIHDKYPNLANLYKGFGASNTSWEKQCFLAAEEIVADLQRRMVLISGHQILDPEMYRDAAVHRAAAMIYNGLGQQYKEQKAEAEKAYKVAINKPMPRVDRNRDGFADQSDLQAVTHFMSR